MSSSPDFLAGGGEMGDRIRAFDWSATPLGPIATWPQSLRSAVSILLPSKAQISLFWGPDLVTLYNDAYRPVFGAKHPAALGRPIREAWDELWRAGLKELFDGVLHTGEAFWAQDLPFFMERHGYLEETYFDVSYDPVRDESGGVGGVFCIVSEKTGRVLGERRLRTLRDLARVAATAGTTAEALRHCADVLGTNPEDVPFALLYAREAQGGMHLAASSGLDASRAPSPDAPWLSVSGLTVQPASVMGEPPGGGPWPEALRQVVVTPLAQGDPAQGCLVCGVSPRRALDDDYRDFVATLASGIAAAVDSARRTQDERRRAEALAQVDRAKTAFFSNVSHEFRTPLTLLMGPVADALADDRHPLAPAQRARLEMAQRSASRLQKLVTSLLDFSRIEAGRAQARYVATDLGALTAELASSFRSAMEKAGLALEVDAAPLGRPAWVDRDLWEKLVLNLLSNAFKFTFEGSVRVRVRETADGFELQVSDTGVGIPASSLPRLFERFHRVEGTRSRTHEGSGIGLALVQEIARLHGGTATVESTEGAGSTFTVRIPAGRDHLDPAHVGQPAERTGATPAGSAFVEEALRWLPGGTGAPAEVPAPAGATARPRIVLADDNADMRDYIRHLLADSYEVEAVADGLAAYEAVRDRGADLVLGDVMMPRLGGLGLLRRLREDKALAGVPIILLSARAGEAARIEGMDAGADDYIEKPFAARELLARVAARLEVARLRSAWASELRLRDKQLRAVTDSAPVLLLQFDAQGRYVFVNEPYARRIGIPPQQFIGRHVHDVLARESYERLAPRIRAALQGEGVEFDEQVDYPELGKRWMHCNYLPQRDEQGRPAGFVAVLQDITDRKVAALRLEEEAQRFEKLNEVGITLSEEPELERIVQVVTDVATQLTTAQFGAFFYNVIQADGESYTLYTLSGVPRERFAGFPMPRNTHVFGPTFRGEGIVRSDDITNDPRYGRNAPYAGMPKGHLPVRSYLAVPVVSRTGEVLGGLFFGHPDPARFTQAAERIVAGIAAQAAVAIENARLKEQRLRLIDELREADRRKDDFIATLSHELRNPLAPLRSGLHVMQLQGAAANDDLLPMMTRQVDQLVRLVDDLLEVSRINRDTFALRRSRVDLRDIVQHAVETAEPLVRDRGQTLDVAMPPRALWLDADAARLAQVLSNLLSNATRYMDPGGRIELHARVEGSRAVVSVRDEGMGFTPDQGDRMFEMFTRGERSQGLGIGLALARRLAEMHGGTLEGASEGPGRGSTFTLALPLGEAAGSGEAPADAPAAGLPPLSVLVVDDNEDAGATLQMLLEVLGMRAKVAADGVTALALFAQDPPDVVLLDIGMPGMDGYQVARALRERHPGWRGALVALTGWGQEEDKRRTQEAGFGHHLVKPVDMQVLQGLLARVGQQGPA
jgi:PAS domain S-box-containing protein